MRRWGHTTSQPMRERTWSTNWRRQGYRGDGTLSNEIALFHIPFQNFMLICALMNTTQGLSFISTLRKVISRGPRSLSLSLLLSSCLSFFRSLYLSLAHLLSLSLFHPVSLSLFLSISLPLSFCLCVQMEELENSVKALTDELQDVKAEHSTGRAPQPGAEPHPGWPRDALCMENR